MKKWILPGISAILTLLLCGCNGGTPEGGGKSGTPSDTSGGKSANAQKIEGAGATFPYPIYKQWFAAYTTANSAQINYQSIGSGAGYTALKDKTVDFAASDAPLSSKEEADLSGPVVHIPTVGGAVVLVYNLPGVASGLHLTPDIIAGIYMGRIKTWDDAVIKAANPSANLPAKPVQPVHRTDGSGTTYIFTHYLKKVSTDWASSIGAGKSVTWPSGMGGKGSDGVAASVTRTEGGVGYVELAYAIEHKLAYASVKNQAGAFVEPSVESTQAAIENYAELLSKDIKTPTVDAPGEKSYPICSLTYVLLYKNGGRNTGGAVKLWDWILQPAQQDQAKTLYYAPLPPALIKINQDALKGIQG